MRMRPGFRHLGLGLLSLAAAGVLMQIGPANGSSDKANGLAGAATKQQGLAAYGKLPLTFTANAGQTDARVRYSAQGSGLSVFLTRKEAMLALQRPGKKGRGKGAAIALSFVGSNRNVAIRGERPGPGTVNYLLGNDPTKWHTGLRTFERVVYRNLWPGVDMVFTGQNGKLKYEFLVRPEARVADIRLAYRGSKPLSLDRQGNLRIRTSLGALTDTRPTSYQLVAGKRVPVRSSFALEPHGGGYSFALKSAYDGHYPLVIDPGLVYSTYLGGSQVDVGSSIALDSAGSAYVMGTTESVDFPTTVGAFDRTYNGSRDGFVTKLDANGTSLIYSTYLGGSGGDIGWGIAGIAVDATGSAYVAGSTDSPDFPTTAGAFDTTFNGGFSDAFVTKLAASGTSLIYSTYLGGSNSDSGFGLALDNAGSAHVGGWTTSTDFPTTGGAFDTTLNGSRDGWVAKLDASGAALGYSTYLGGSGFDVPDDGYGIGVDATGSTYVAGSTTSADFPTTAGAFDTTFNGGSDGFVTKLDAGGAALGYSTYLGGNNGENGNDIAVDGGGSAYVGGWTTSTNFPTTVGAFDTTYNEGYDAFVAKLDASGAALDYSTYLGGSADDRAIGIALDATSSAYLTGYTHSTDFPTTPGAFDMTSNGDFDAFVTKLDDSGAALGYSSYLGGQSADAGTDIALAGSAYVAGYTYSANFPTTVGAFDTTYNGSWDAFVTKLDLVAGPPPPPPPPPPPSPPPPPPPPPPLPPPPPPPLPPPPPPRPHYWIVSFGDSYTAGNGAGNYYGSRKCHRSYDSYPWRFKTRIRGATADIWQAACSSAINADIHIQVSQVRRNIRLAAKIVFLTTGGNDFDFKGIATDCLVTRIYFWRCASRIHNAVANFPSITAATKRQLKYIHTKLPSAKIVLVGYPKLTSPRCPLTPWNGALANLQDSLNTAQSTIVRDANRETNGTWFFFQKLSRTFQGHGPCASRSRMWIHNVQLPLFEAFHPTKVGHEAIASLLLARNDIR